jgi:hypothetical protein
LVRASEAVIFYFQAEPIFLKIIPEAKNGVTPKKLLFFAILA